MNSITTYEEMTDCEMQPKQSTIEFLQTFARIIYAEKLDCGIMFSMILN